MSFKNTKIEFGFITKIFHWVLAFLILSMLLAGFYMVDIPDGALKFQIYGWHKSVGLLIIFLAGLRGVWRLFNKPPLPLDTHQKWEKSTSKIVHFLLYMMMVAMLLSGWIMSDTGPYPLKFFGLPVPNIFSESSLAAQYADSVHEIIAYVLVCLIMFHILGAIKHHVIDQDKTLIRMIPNVRKRIWKPILIIFLVFIGSGILRFGFIEKQGKEVIVAERIEKSVTQEETEVEKINPYTWSIVEDQSEIKFVVDIYNSKLESTFSQFNGPIIFNENDLAASHADININLKTVDSGDAERNAQMIGEEWFNVADQSIANFKTVKFQKIEKGHYIAVGNLKLAGQEKLISFPFTLDIVKDAKGKRAYIQGQFTINRLDFDLGGENWKASDIVGHNVGVTVRLVAENYKN